MLKTHLLLPAVLCTATMLIGAAHAHVQKTPVPCGDKICLWERPAIDPPPGWMLDDSTSRRTLVSMYVPNGSSFSETQGVFYAKAIALEGTPFLTFISRDLDRMLAQQLHSVTLPTKPLRTADKDVWPTYRIAPRRNEKGSVETLVYGEEDGYAIVFVLSARDDASHTALLPLFTRWVGTYTKAKKN